MDELEIQQFYDEFFEEVYVELEKVGVIPPYRVTNLLKTIFVS